MSVMEHLTDTVTTDAAALPAEKLIVLRTRSTFGGYAGKNH
jgi:hypothetical protein